MMTNLRSIVARLICSQADGDVTGPLLVTLDSCVYEFNSPMREWDFAGDGPTSVFTHCDQSSQSGVQTWYAFSSARSRALFMSLMKADKVGGVTALKIMARTHFSEILKLIEDGDAEGICKLPGVGPKTGEALVKVLIPKGKKKATAPAQPEKPKKPDIGGNEVDAIAALVVMGWDAKEAEEVIIGFMVANKEKELSPISTEEYVRMASRRGRRKR